MIRMVGSTLVKKQFPKQFIRNAHSSGGIPGESLPFKVGGNPWVMTMKFVAFFSVAWWAPYFVVALQMHKV